MIIHVIYKFFIGMKIYMNCGYFYFTVTSVLFLMVYHVLVYMMY